MPNTLDNILANILNIYSAYTQDPRYVYKKCRDDYMVILKKPLDIMTNENRKSVKNPLFAKFRADKLDVMLIFNTIEPTKTITIAYSIFDCDFKYDVGKQISETYDTNDEIICGQGIHYFKTIEAAFYYELSTTILENNYGRYIKCHDNGNINYCVKYGYMLNCWTREEWDENGNKIHERSYDIINGKKSYECNYENGNKTYECIGDGNKIEIYRYRNGIKTYEQYKNGIKVL